MSSISTSLSNFARAACLGVMVLGAMVYGPLVHGADPVTTTPSRTDLHRRFEKMLTGVTLEGTFSIRGKAGPPAADRYEIRQVTKQPEGEYWILMTRVQYGDHDVTIPVPVEVLWAGETPVITVNSVTLPGLGTFDARVLLHDGLYGGTWRHGEITGSMWGEIKGQTPAK